MFKAICIKEVTTNPDQLRPAIKVGEEYTVVQVVKCYCGCGIDYYVIAEDTPDNCYRYDLFAPLDGPDEVAIAESRIKADAEALDAEWGRLMQEMEEIWPV